MSAARAGDTDGVGPTRTKRRAAALSCAECRRLKLRCDRKFPCSACVKRGCSQICPQGSLTTGKGNRFVLANTEQLHEKINELSHRVRSLEDALSVAHNSEERHPLLSDELLQIKNPLEREVVLEQPRQQEEEDVIDAVGSLSISHSGRTNFYGQTANSWYLLQNEEGNVSDEDDEHDLAVPSDPSWVSRAFPFSPPLSQPARDDLRMLLIASLPDAPSARALSELYFANAAWMYHPITREQFDLQVFARVYADSPTGESPGSDGDIDRDSGSYESHRLAVLFIVLAVGILVDLGRGSHDPASATYFHLAKVALSLDSVLEEPSILAIQALLAMCHYMFLNDVDTQRWTLMGIVVKIAQSLGLHRDSARWNLSPEETKRRRELFWEIYVYDSWQSLTYGRPPSLSTAHIDCKMAHETVKNASGQIEMTFDAWKHRFSSECLSIVHDQVFGAKTPSYATVTELDKRVRNYYIPPSLQVPGFGGSVLNGGTDLQSPSPMLTMQRYIILAIKEVTIFYMHRGFFAKAMSDYPSDPLSAKYGHSVLRAHESASFFVTLVRSLWLQQRDLAERNWFLFTHVFSCAIVLGSIPTRCPSMALARSALQSLNQAYDLFQQVGEKTRAAKVLTVLGKLRDRAQASMNEFQGQGQNREPTIFPKRESPHDTLHMKQEPDELTTLGGKTRLVSPRSGGTGSSRGSRSPPTQSPLVSFSSPPPQTPTSPSSNPQSQSAYYTDPYSRRGYESAESAYPPSPEFAFLGHGNGNGQMQSQVHSHGVPHLQTAHVQNQAYAHHGQWSSGSSIPMNYGAPMDTSSSLPQVANTGLPVNVAHSQQQVAHGNGLDNISMLDMHGLHAQGNYSMNGTYYGAPEYRNNYAVQQSYLPSPSDVISPQDMDLSGAWGSFMNQYGTN